MRNRSSGVAIKLKWNKKTPKNIIFYGFMGFLAVITLISLIVIIGYILINGIAHIDLEFLTQEPRKMGKEGGIFSVIIGTIYVTAVGIIVATPIGVLSAIHFNEYAKEGKGVHIILFYRNTCRNSIYYIWLVWICFLCSLFRYGLVRNLRGTYFSHDGFTNLDKSHRGVLENSSYVLSRR